MASEPKGLSQKATVTYNPHCRQSFFGPFPETYKKVTVDFFPLPLEKHVLSLAQGNSSQTSFTKLQRFMAGIVRESTASLSLTQECGGHWSTCDTEKSPFHYALKHIFPPPTTRRILSRGLSNLKSLISERYKEIKLRECLPGGKAW